MHARHGVLPPWLGTGDCGLPAEDGTAVAAEVAGLLHGCAAARHEAGAAHVAGSVIIAHQQTRRGRSSSEDMRATMRRADRGEALRWQ